MTYVSARNLICRAGATAFAEVTGADDIVLGITAVDYSGYPDCRPEFLAALASVANLATKADTECQRLLQFHAPRISYSKDGTRDPLSLNRPN